MPVDGPEVSAARKAASGFGLDAETVILGRSKNVTIHLLGTGTVARVTSLRRLRTSRREVSVALHGIEVGAPVVSPSLVLPPGPHVEGEHAVTFWTFVPSKYCESDTDIAAAADALSRFHATMSKMSAELPSFRKQIAGCHASLLDQSLLPMLRPSDRNLLLRAHDLYIAQLEEFRFAEVVLHGDAHTGNVLIADDGPLWTDFEDVCRGLREWDVCRFGEPEHFADADQQLLEVLTVLRSMCVATWCWASASVPGKRNAAEQHMELIRTKLVS